MSQLIAFYRGEGPDARGRTLAELWAYSDAEMEAIHDFIQWMFPLREPSRFNPDAPLVDDLDVRAFRDDPRLRQALLRSFGRFLAFLGLKHDEFIVSEAADFDSKKSIFLRANHNWLRITRVLASTRMLGLEAESRAFFAFLRDRRDAGAIRVDPTTFRYWRDAAEGETGRPRA